MSKLDLAKPLITYNEGTPFTVQLLENLKICRVSDGHIAIVNCDTGQWKYIDTKFTGSSLKNVPVQSKRYFNIYHDGASRDYWYDKDTTTGKIWRGINGCNKYLYTLEETLEDDVVVEIKMLKL